MAIPRAEFERVRDLVNYEIERWRIYHEYVRETAPGAWKFDIRGAVMLRIEEIKQSIAYGTDQIRTGRPMLVLHFPYDTSKFRPRRAAARIDERLVKNAIGAAEQMEEHFTKRYGLDDPVRLEAYLKGRDRVAALPEEERREFWLDWREARQDPHFARLWAAALEEEPEFWSRIIAHIGGEMAPYTARDLHGDGVGDELSDWATKTGMPGLYPWVRGKAKEWSPRERLVEP